MVHAFAISFGVFFALLAMHQRQRKIVENVGDFILIVMASVLFGIAFYQ
jgi:hypothetical protein